MHGLFNRAIQRFLTGTYGPDLWEEIIRRADLESPEFEALLLYEDRVTQDVLSAAADRLGKPSEDILEDLGTYLISNPSSDTVRRLLRFGGADFTGFLWSLHDLPDRARLAMPDLDLPEFSLTQTSDTAYSLECRTRCPEFCHVTLGALRAMADDYGALVGLDSVLKPGYGATITVSVYQAAYHEGREFMLGGRAS